MLTVDHQALSQAAKKHRCVLELHFKPGRFVLAAANRPWPVLGADPVSDEFSERVREAVAIGPEPSPAQDVEVLDPATGRNWAKGLSLRVNDPSHGHQRHPPSWLRAGQHGRQLSKQDTHIADDAGDVRVLAERTSLSGAFDASLNQIRQAGRSSSRDPDRARGCAWAHSGFR